MRTITARLMVWYTTLLGVILATASFAMYSVYENQIKEALDNDIISSADYLRVRLRPRSLDTPALFERFHAKYRKTRPDLRGHSVIINSSDSMEVELNSRIDPKEVVGSLRDMGILRRADTLGILATVSYDGKEYRTLTMLVHAKSGPMHLIVVASLARTARSLDFLWSILIFGFPLTLLVALIGGWLIIRRALKPVRNITEAAATISASNFNMRVPVGSGRDELSQLALKFNMMIARLDAAFKSQRQFIADASHDLRTPLTVLQMELELLLLGGKTDEEIKDALERALTEADRLNSLAGDLLLLARADADGLTLDRTNLRIDDLLLECVSQLDSIAAKRGITFRVDIDEMVELSADMSLLRRAFMNVIDNAIRYSNDNSSLQIEVSSAEHTTTIAISNTGPGIPAEELPRIFDRFYRGDSMRSSKGTGLGLAIVKAVIEAHGGGVTAKSDVGSGTTVTITLPS